VHSEIGCEIIRDLLPPYADGLASPQTRALVDGHLEGCEPCSQALEQLRSEETAAPLPPGKALARVKKKIKRKRLYIAVISAVIAIAVLTTGYIFLFEWYYPIPYNEDYVRVERVNNALQLDDDGYLFLGNFQLDLGMSTHGYEYIDADGNVQLVEFVQLRKPFINIRPQTERPDGRSSGGSPLEWSLDEWENRKRENDDLPGTARLICKVYYLQDFRKLRLLDYPAVWEDVLTSDELLRSCILIWEGDITPE